MRFLVLLVLLVLPAGASAQHRLETLGSRAIGMAGAFVAVADDATAVYWNPAGLATGPAFGTTIEWNRLRFGDPDAGLRPGPTQGDSSLYAVGTLPLGLSYIRQETVSLVTGPGGSTRAHLLETRQFAATILQTVTQGLVVGSTLKYVHGSAVSGETSGLSIGDALDAADDLDGDGDGDFDLDLGVMADLSRVRIGLLWKNLLEPEFGDVAESATRLERLARLGVAVLPFDGLTLAMDVDLNTVGLRDGLRRMVALGGESRLGTRLAVRAGVRWDLEGAREPTTAIGASVAVRASMWLDGHYTRSTNDGDQGFGVALRAGY